MRAARIEEMLDTGLVTAALLRWTLRGESRVITVSRVQPDGGVALARSAQVLRKAIADAQ